MNTNKIIETIQTYRNASEANKHRNMSKNKRGLSCAKLSQQSTTFLGPMELFFWFELLMVVLLNCWIVELLIC